MASRIGVLLEISLLIASIASCVLYIWQTYLPSYESNLSIAFEQTEGIISSVFIINWFLRLFVADHTLEYFFSFFSILEILTCLTVIMSFNIEPQNIENWENISNGFTIYYLLRFLRTLRLLRILHVRKAGERIKEVITRHIVKMTIYIAAMVLFDAGVMQFLERNTDLNNTSMLGFHDWIYFVIVSVSTVGYGDISPDSPLGRLGSVIIICFALLFLPTQTNTLLELMAQTTIYARASYKQKGGHSEHVLICGDLESTNLQEFFDELFHEDH